MLFELEQAGPRAGSLYKKARIELLVEVYLAAVKGQLEVQATTRVCMLKVVYSLPAIIEAATKSALYHIYSQI